MPIYYIIIVIIIIYCVRLKHVSPCRRDLHAAYGLLLIYMLIQSQNSISAFYLYRTIRRDRINYMRLTVAAVHI